LFSVEEANSQHPLILCTDDAGVFNCIAVSSNERCFCFYFCFSFFRFHLKRLTASTPTSPACLIAVSSLSALVLYLFLFLCFLCTLANTLTQPHSTHDTTALSGEYHSMCSAHGLTKGDTTALARAAIPYIFERRQRQAVMAHINARFDEFERTAYSE
jgi:hypothetical protein